MCYSKWSGYLDVPMNRLATQTVCYFLFLVWILLTMINPSDDPDKVDWNVYDILAFVWTLGYIISDVQMMHQLTESLRMHSASSKYKVGGNTFPAEKKAVKVAFSIRLGSCTRRRLAGSSPTPSSTTASSATSSTSAAWSSSTLATRWKESTRC